MSTDAKKKGILGMGYGTEEKLFNYSKVASAAIFFVFGVFPVYWMAQSSLKTRQAVTSPDVT
ncbi:MAG TPA: hypothetical protein VKA37_06985, partial [Halobacteriales archaeon]|nr:hypothetical protein [Halobacteriales archaeon]